MPDFEGKVFLFWNRGATFRQVFKRIDRLNQTTKPALSAFRFVSKLADESNVLLGIG